MMTTADDANVHALAIEGTFDDCQALVKALFNHHAFRDRVRLSGVNSINWARIVAQVVYYFTAAVALGAPHRKVAFTVPTGNFGDVFAGYVAQAHGPADRPAGDRHQRQRHPGAHARDRRLRGARRGRRPRRPRWTSRSRRISSGCCSRPTAATPRAVRALMGSLAQSRQLHDRRGRRSPRSARAFAAGRADEDETAATIRTRAARDRLSRRSAHRRRASRSPRRNTRDPAVPMVVLSTAHPAKFPDAVEAACGVRPALPDWLADLERAAGARHRAAGRSGRGRELHILRPAAPRAKELPHERRSHPSAVRPDRRHRRDAASARRASLGVWVGAGSRDERAGRARHLASARAHGVQGHDAPHRAPDRRGDRGGRRRPQRRDQRRDHRLLCARAAAPTCRSRSTCSPTSCPIRPSIRRNLRARRTSSCRRSAPPRTRPTISMFEHLQAHRVSRTSRSAARSSARRETRALVRRRKQLRAYLARNYRGARHGGRGRRRGRSRGDRRRGRAALSRASPAPQAPAPEPARFVGGTRIEQRDLEQVHVALGAARACRSAIPRSTACRSSPTCWAAACRRGCSRRCARSAGSATRSMRSTAPYSDTGMFGLYAGTDATDAARTDARRGRRDRQRGRDRSPRPRSPAPRRR